MEFFAPGALPIACANSRAMLSFQTRNCAEARYKKTLPPGSRSCCVLAGLVALQTVLWPRGSPSPALDDRLLVHASLLFV